MQTLTKRISVMSFIATWCVVMIHFTFVSPRTSVLYSIITSWLTQWAVPWFFFASGMFAFISLRKNTLMAFCVKKFRGLVLPYVLWCSVPALALCAFGTVKYKGVGDVFALTNGFPFCNPPLWYLRSLIGSSVMLLALDKALFRLPKGRFVVAASFIALVWVLGCCGVGIFGTPTSPFYFIVGYLIGGFGIRMDNRKPLFPESVWMLSVCWGLWIILRGTCSWGVISGVFEMVIRNLSVVLSVVVIWFTFEQCRLFDRELPKWASGTFFTYCIHVPVLMALAPLTKSMMDFPDAVVNIVYILFILVGPMFFFAFAFAAKRTMPRLYGILTGGR